MNSVAADFCSSVVVIQIDDVVALMLIVAIWPAARRRRLVRGVIIFNFDVLDFANSEFYETLVLLPNTLVVSDYYKIASIGRKTHSQTPVRMMTL